MRADHIAQDVIHLDFKSPQGWHNLFGQLLVVLGCSYDENGLVFFGFFPYILSESLIST